VVGESSEANVPGSTSSGVDIDALADRFDAAWRAGEEPQIEDYVGQALAAKHSEASQQLLLELVMVDLEHRWRRASETANRESPATIDRMQDLTPQPMRKAGPLLEDYVQRFPALGSSDSFPEEAIAFEYRVRHLWGDKPSRQSFESRFPRHTPALLERLAKIDGELSSRQPRDIATGAGKESAMDTAAALDTSVTATHDKAAPQPEGVEFGDYILQEEIAGKLMVGITSRWASSKGKASNGASRTGLYHLARPRIW